MLFRTFKLVGHTFGDVCGVNACRGIFLAFIESPVGLVGVVVGNNSVYRLDIKAVVTLLTLDELML